MVGALGLVPVLSAQPPTQPTFRASTTLAQIEVVVIDATGQPVHGLTRDDFSIVEGVTNRPVVAFEELSRGDDFNDLGPRASLAFTTTSGKQKTGFTTDRSKVLALIDAFEGGKKQRNPGVPTFGIPADLRVGTSANGEQDVGAARMSEPPPGAPGDLGALFGDIATFDALADTAERLLAEQGRRKAFIFVSQGTALTRLPGRDARAATMASLWRSGVAVYTIDPRGHVPHGSHLMFVECSGDTDCMRETWQRTLVEDAQMGLAGLAQATGSRAIVNTDELDEGVSQVRDDLTWRSGHPPYAGVAAPRAAQARQTSRGVSRPTHS